MIAGESSLEEEQRMEEPVPVHAWGGGGVAVGVERKSKDTWGGAGGG